MSSSPLWSKTATEELHQLWCIEGRPISHITKTMGRSDWSIRGKIRYEGWPLPNNVRTASLSRGMKARLDRVRQPGPVDAKPSDKRALLGKAWTALPGSQPVSLIDLGPGLCKWPIGQDRPYTFCGEPSGERSYCSHHAKLSVGQGTATERVAHRARQAVPA